MLYGRMPLEKSFKAVGVKMFRAFYITAKYFHCIGLIDQRKMLFLQKMKNCDNSIVWMLSTLDMCVGKLMSKYSMQKVCITTSILTQRLWEHFVDTSITNGKIVVFT